MKLIEQLLKAGAVYTKEPETYRDRAKSYGHMWGGSASLKLDNVEYLFELWHHGADDESTEGLLEHFSLKGVRTVDRFYDPNWYTIQADSCIWLHKTGWFGFEPKKRSLAENELVRRRGNPNFCRPTYTKDEEKQLKKLGFRKLVEFK